MREETIVFFTGLASWVASVFIPILGLQVGASYSEIGLITISFNGANLLSAWIFGRAADLHGTRAYLLGGLMAAVGGTGLQVLATPGLPGATPAGLLAIRVVAGFAHGVYPAALMAHIYESRKGLGGVLAYSALGLAAGAFLAGLTFAFVGDVQADGWRAVFLLASILYALCFVIALRLPLPDQPAKPVWVPMFPRANIRRNIPIYLPLLLRHTGASSIWVIFPIYLAQFTYPSFLGIATERVALFWVGILLSVNHLSQFVVTRLLDPYRSTFLFPLGLFLSGVTFLGYAASTGPWGILVFQLLIGVSWSTMYIGALKFVMDKEGERATSAGLTESTLRLSGIIGPITGGILVDVFHDYRVTMVFAAAMTFASLGIYRITLREPGPPTVLEPLPVGSIGGTHH